MKQRLTGLGIACIAIAAAGSPVYAGGFAQEDLTPAGLGVANAMAASNNDLSSAMYNASGLAWQQGTQLMIGNISRYRSLSGDVGTGDHNLKDKPIFALSWMPEGDNWGVATSITTAYARRTWWRGAFANALGETILDMQRYAVDGFWRVNNGLGLSLGADIYDSALRVDSDGTTFAGSGWSNVGLHGGLNWEFSPFWRLGMHMRKGADVSMSNSVGAAVDLSTPDEMTLGVAHSLLDDEISLELDIKRSAWSGFDGLYVVNKGVTSQSLPAKMRDTMDVMLGATWYWRHDTQFRIGYAYEQGANELNGYQPALADQTGHRFAIGFGGDMTGMHLDMAWTWIHYPTVDVTGDYAGAYSDDRYSLMVTLTKRF